MSKRFDVWGWDHPLLPCALPSQSQRRRWHHGAAGIGMKKEGPGFLWFYVGVLVYYWVAYFRNLCRCLIHCCFCDWCQPRQRENRDVRWEFCRDEPRILSNIRPHIKYIDQSVFFTWVTSESGESEGWSMCDFKQGANVTTRRWILSTRFFRNLEILRSVEAFESTAVFGSPCLFCWVFLSCTLPESPCGSPLEIDHVEAPIEIAWNSNSWMILILLFRST